MKPEAVKDISRIFAEEGHLIDEALKKGARDAMVRHKRAGLSVVIYRDGKTVFIPPHEITVE
jgi:hypothetical protein